MDSNRIADRTVLPRSLMGLKRGERHTAHPQQMNPQFAPKAVLQGAGRLEEVSSLYLGFGNSGETRHGSLKADLHHWSANSLGSFLCGEEWEQRPDLSEYLAAIGELEEAISFRAFHPFFVRWLFPVRASRARIAYRYLFDHLEAAVERRLQHRRTPSTGGGVAAGRAGSAGRPEAGASHRQGQLEPRGVCRGVDLAVAGGTDAMSYTLAQALYLLSRNPDVQDQARAEILKTGVRKRKIFQTGILQPKTPGRVRGTSSC
jgi:cytochrome P450